MKIACICNLNHAQYIVARYLRDFGHEVTLFLMEEQLNFNPENDSYEGVKGIKVEQLPWKHKELYKISKQEIVQKLGGFDFYLASEFAPAFLFKAGIKVNVYIPIGTDLIDYPFRKMSQTFPPIWEINEQQFHIFQRGGIRNATSTFINQNGDLFLERALINIPFEGKRFPISLPYMYLPELVSEIAISPFKEQIKTLRAEHDVMIISHGRCEFTNPNSVHNKGTDILLKGFAGFVKNSSQKACLVLMKYGSDLQATEKLAKDLGIEDSIVWLPASGRKDIFPILPFFDAVVGNLFYSHWSYNVAMEAIACKIPLIQRGPEKQENKDQIYPYFHASSVAELMTVFESISNSNAESNLIATKAHKWFTEVSIDTPLAWLKEVIDGKWDKKSMPLSFSKERVHWFFMKYAVGFMSALISRFSGTVKLV
jgi:glycosyltransferase involved in cell wall biosynthesis